MTTTAEAQQANVHFPDSEWVDFVHHLLPASRERELRSHIDSACPECVRSVEFWSSITHTLSAKPDPQPSLQLIRAAEELFAQRKPWAWLHASAEWARRLFDSLQQPTLATVRGSTADVRHLIYEAEPFVIDVTMKADAGQASLYLLGQVLNSRTPGQVSGDEIHVLLLSGQDLVAKTVAASSGEFELYCEMHSDLSLFISVRGERAIGLSLADSGNGNSTR